MTRLSKIIDHYYNQRGYVWPDFADAMKFIQTELGEVYELDLARSANYVRNNPQNKPQFDLEALAEELGDVLMMVMVAGMVEGVDPMQALEDKLQRKLHKLNLPPYMED
jgi:NTP pyrophosphatase (non-canonical NTP hydrolase)